MVEKPLSVGPMYGVGSFQRPLALTDDQKQTAASILSQYDSKNLKAEDAKSIFNAFREAGIRPGSGLQEVLTSAGFDPQQFRALTRPDKSQGKAEPKSQTGVSKIDLTA